MFKVLFFYSWGSLCIEGIHIFGFSNTMYENFFDIVDIEHVIYVKWTLLTYI